MNLPVLVSVREQSTKRAVVASPNPHLSQVSQICVRGYLSKDCSLKRGVKLSFILASQRYDFIDPTGNENCSDKAV